MASTIYRIDHDHDQFQYFLLDDDADADRFVEWFVECTGQPVGKEWCTPKVIVEQPKLRKSDFLNFGAAPLIISGAAKDALKRHWRKDAVELLPLTYRRETYYVVNVLRQIDCLLKKNGKAVAVLSSRHRSSRTCRSSWCLSFARMCLWMSPSRRTSSVWV